MYREQFDPKEVQERYAPKKKLDLNPHTPEEKERIIREVEEERRAMRRSVPIVHSERRPKKYQCNNILLQKPIKINNHTYWILPGCDAWVSRWNGETRHLIHYPNCLINQWKLNNQEEK